jgi:hypothetical protein
VLLVEIPREDSGEDRAGFFLEARPDDDHVILTIVGA